MQKLPGKKQVWKVFLTFNSYSKSSDITLVKSITSMESQISIFGATLFLETTETKS